MFYPFLRQLIWLVVRIFFRRIEIHGRENIPRDGPLILASNHPNMILDPFMVSILHQRRVHFLGKSTLFRIPGLAWLLTAFGVIPVYRRKDDPGSTQRNQEAFRACHEVLATGGAIGIFPEGVSELGHRLRPLKTGTARIALEAEESREFGLGIQIVPVGLNFQSGHLFRSDVLVLVGASIEVTSYRDEYRRDEREAVRKLTTAIEAELEKVTRNVREAADAEFLAKLERIYHEGYLGRDRLDPHPDLRSRFEVEITIRDAYAYFLEQEPDRVRRVRSMIEAYLELVDRIGTGDRHVGTYRGIGSILGEVGRALPVLLLGLPLWLYGVITNYLPYRLVGILAERVSTDIVEIATNKIAMGLLLYPASFLALGLLVGFSLGWLPALLALVSFPFAGLFVLAWVDRLRPVHAALRVGLFFRSDRDRGLRLKVEREKILEELRLLTERYLGQHPSPATTPVPARD